MDGDMLYRFMDGVIDRGRIAGDDVLNLTRDVVPDGLTCRDEADLLIALDRAIAEKDPSFADALVRLVVDYVVWVSRPTGTVDAETARWLITSLACGDGPTDTALRIAFEVVRESQRSDESLVAFVLRARRRALAGPGARREILRGALAA